jgi:hypothetical protein
MIWFYGLKKWILYQNNIHKTYTNHDDIDRFPFGNSWKRCTLRSIWISWRMSLWWVYGIVSAPDFQMRSPVWILPNDWHKSAVCGDSLQCHSMQCLWNRGENGILSHYLVRICVLSVLQGRIGRNVHRRGWVDVVLELSTQGSRSPATRQDHRPNSPPTRMLIRPLPFLSL